MWCERLREEVEWKIERGRGENEMEKVRGSVGKKRIGTNSHTTLHNSNKLFRNKEEKKKRKSVPPFQGSLYQYRQRQRIETPRECKRRKCGRERESGIL